MRILIKKTRILDPTQGLDFVGDILIENGIIKGVDRNIQCESKGLEIINGEGLWCFPGVIDMHVHLREPGEEWKEDIETGTKSALYGGVLRLACMPNTKPPIDSPELVQFVLKKAEEKGYVKVYPIACITKNQKGENLTEFGLLKQTGAVAVSDDGKWVVNSDVMKKALLYAKQFDMPVISHCEDPFLSKGGSVNLGKISAKLGLKGIPESAEVIAIFRDIFLAKETQGFLHIAHVSLKESINIIKKAKEEGIQFTVETCPHYFLLTEEEVDNYNTYAKVNPPLRTYEDICAIKEALKQGIIDVIASDHAPHSVLEKEVEFEIASPGIIGVQFLVPLSYTLVEEKILTPLKWLECLITNPAKILRIDPPMLKADKEAELVLFNPTKKYKLKKEMIKSKSHNTPFLDKVLKGKIEKVILKDKIFNIC